MAVDDEEKAVAHKRAYAAMEVAIPCLYVAKGAAEVYRRFALAVV
jgi:hypothetical protein